jgi:hypothetical protein
MSRMSSGLDSSAFQRAGAWIGRSTTALFFTLVFAAVFFVPSFLLVDRYPRARLIGVLRILGFACLLLIPLTILVLVQSGAWQRDTVLGTLLGAAILLGAALGFLRAAQHGDEVAALRPEGDPLAHWTRVLGDHPRWWIRSRAARELGASTMQGGEARDSLLAARSREDNRHVRGAIAQSLTRLNGRLGRQA